MGMGFGDLFWLILRPKIGFFENPFADMAVGKKCPHFLNGKQSSHSWADEIVHASGGSFCRSRPYDVAKPIWLQSKIVVPSVREISVCFFFEI